MLAPAELRRALAPAWRSVDRTNPVALDWVLGITTEALLQERRPTDRAIVTTWLDVFPNGAGAPRLAAAAAVAAERHDWPYRQAGRKYNLWDAGDAVAALGPALLAAEDPDDILRAAALTPGLYDARLVQQSLVAAANGIADAPTRIASTGCASLLRLLNRIGIAPMILPEVVRALLKPWRDELPAEALRIEIQRFLLREVGDPRSQPARWAQLAQVLVDRGYRDDAAALVLIFKRWLVQASFELFFKLVSASTNKPGQWDRRESFWRHYLERSLVDDARFVLGIDGIRSSSG